jgi:hypothetical protein
MKKLLLAGACALALSGCAAQVYHPTESGKVEAIITKATVKQVDDEIIPLMLNQHYLMRRQSDNMLLFEKPRPGTPLVNGGDERVTYFIMQTDGGTHVVCDLQIVIGANTKYEHAFNTNNESGSAAFQKSLNAIKAKFDGAGS